MMYVGLIFSFLFPLAMFWIPARFKRQGLRAFLVRRSLIAGPYLVWLTVFDLNSMKWNLGIGVLFIAIVLLLISWEWKDFCFKSSAQYAQLAGPISKSAFLVNIFNLLLFLIGEEAFFRLGILTALPFGWAVLMQSLAFVAAHRFTPWGSTFKTKDIVRQFVFSLSAGVYFLVTRDLFLCLIGHLILNSAEFIHYGRRGLLEAPSEEELYGAF